MAPQNGIANNAVKKDTNKALKSPKKLAIKNHNVAITKTKKNVAQTHQPILSVIIVLHLR